MTPKLTHGAGPPPLSPDHRQLRGAGGVDEGHTVHRDRRDDLEADSEPAGEVDPRLDAEDHPFFQGLPAALHQVRRLVDLEPEAVAGPVEERLAVARGGDVPARGAVDLLTGR